jgi:hypothetical protein
MSDNQDTSSGEFQDDSLKERGFEAGEPVLSFDPSFTLDDLKEAHYGSTYADPKPLRIEFTTDIVVQMVVGMSRAVYIAFEEFSDASYFGSYKRPDWYVEGWLARSGFDPYSEIVRVRLYLRTEPSGKFGGSHFQRIPVTPDLHGHIKVHNAHVL